MMIVLLLAACGSNSSHSADAAPSIDATPTIDAPIAPPDSGLSLGAPITAPLRTWTWVDFPGAVCDDGSPTGIGVYLNDATTNVLVFFMGGGACWDYQTCYVLNTAVHGPFGKPQFDAIISGVANTVVDPADAASPFKDWSFVFVPYCTGDEHAGDNVAMYSNGTGTTMTYHHAGHTNALAYLSRLAATFPSPGKLVVSGSSAGGGGALYNYPSFRAYWPSSKLYLLDDSLPLMEGDTIPPGFRMAMFVSWGLGDVTDPLCGAPCRSDLSQWMKTLAQMWPGDRMALVSSQQDQTVRGFYLLTAAGYQAALTNLVTDVLAPTAKFRAFLFAGQTHTTLGDPANAAYTTNGVQLWTWLTQMVGDDPAWQTQQP
jgi:hypothetical protein